MGYFSLYVWVRVSAEAFFSWLDIVTVISNDSIKCSKIRYNTIRGDYRSYRCWGVLQGMIAR